jgi:hypothetical protein
MTIKMPKLIFKEYNEDDKSVKCRNIINDACYKFFSIGIDKVEDACNNRINEIIAECKAKHLDDSINLTHEISGTIIQSNIYNCKDVTSQLYKPFKLFTPEFIEVYIRKEKNNDWPAQACKEKPIIEAFLGSMELEDDTHTLIWRINQNDNKFNRFPYYIEDVIYHELLHICGEITCDGTIRYNWVGIVAIHKLLKA